MKRINSVMTIIALMAISSFADDVQNGVNFFKQKEYSKAVESFKKACENSNSDGCYFLSRVYAEGLGVKKDILKASKLLEQSCNGGNAYGCGDLAYMYLSGENIKQDKLKATELFIKACNGGDPESCSTVGVMYAKGEGIEQNEFTAKNLFKKGCELNNESSCKNYTVLSGETILPEKVCLNMERVNNSMTPVQLSNYGYYCIAENKYEDAGKLLITSIAYGAYDRLRVKDKTAHQASVVLQMQLGSALTKEQQEVLRQTLSSMMHEKSTCELLEKVGKPSYYPSYMINHGLHAQTPQPIVSDFDPENGWDLTLKDYIKCKAQ